MIHDLPAEVYYDDPPITIRLHPRTPDYAAGALLVVVGALLGWYARGLLAIPYDYQLLELFVIVTCYIVASRRDI